MYTNFLIKKIKKQLYFRVAFIFIFYYSPKM